MAQVIFKRKTTAEINELPIVDGQLIWNTETGETYIDIGKERVQTGGIGVKDYDDLESKPQINDIELTGNKTLEELGIQKKGDYALNTDVNNLSEEIENLQNKYSETMGKNIFHTESIVEGKFINWQKGEVNTHADYFYTENGTQVEPNTTYTASWYNSNKTYNTPVTGFLLFYNSADEFISGIEIGSTAKGVFTTPEDCNYIRYSGKIATWNTLLLQIEKGDTYSEEYEEYVPNTTILKEEYIPIDYIKEECNRRSYIFVDKNGNGDYTTVTEAVANAEDGSTIIVAPGNYINEVVEGWGKEINIIGLSREKCIISNDTATYSTPPIEIGKGSIENLTVIAELGTGISNDTNKWFPYAVHTEDNNLQNSTLTIRNCTLISELNAGFGLGMYGGCTVNLENTHLIGRNGAGNRALFFHDAASAIYAGEQNININNCILESDSKSQHTLRIEDQCIDGSTINLTMINTLIYNGQCTNCRLGTSNKDGQTYEGWRNLKNTKLTGKSFGNNIDVFNS